MQKFFAALLSVAILAFCGSCAAGAGWRLGTMLATGGP